MLTINEARKGAAVESVNGIISAAETQYMSSMLTGNTVSRYDFPENKLSYKGTRPESGTLVIDKLGNVSVTAKVNGYCVRKRYTENSPTIIDDEECKIEESEIASADIYKEEILNGADPVVSGNLIPVTISDDGTVTKADTKQSWYNYGNKVWANAVILKDENITYEVNATIPEENIESYFVWIPRYKYQLFYEDNYATTIEAKPTESNAQTINIVFENKNTEVSAGTASGEWLTHPAFTAFDTNGIWVGKFETGYNDANSEIMVKPNVHSWRNVSVSDIFGVAYNYNRTLDSHMMKNTEWGAVAYLSHSHYGINTEVNANNNADKLTGYSAVDGTTYETQSTVTLPYNTETGYKASTTGNISGVYDMNGGAVEYMASYIENTFGGSGFTTDSISVYDSKYFDVYNKKSEWLKYEYRILGDATGEMGPFYKYVDDEGKTRRVNSWYGDLPNFLAVNKPWVLRGGDYTTGPMAGGQFYFNHNEGAAGFNYGSRLVLGI